MLNTSSLKAVALAAVYFQAWQLNPAIQQQAEGFSKVQNQAAKAVAKMPLFRQFVMNNKAQLIEMEVRGLFQ